MPHRARKKYFFVFFSEQIDFWLFEFLQVKVITVTKVKYLKEG